MTKFVHMSKIHLNQSINCLHQLKRKLGIEKLKNPKAFIDYSQTIDVMKIWKTMIQQRKVSMVFDDMIGDRKGNKKLSPAVTEFFLRGAKNSKFQLFLYHNLISKCLKL